ncbi:hypothetical protein ABZ896_23615 [Streptomyces sp. NPDC047072]|uniref:hypothetical protein n=1 Tax=Streptomyces sp. NPDC047072 TaxID=3154809 RepID=UPI0033CC7EF8
MTSKAARRRFKKAERLRAFREKRSPGRRGRQTVGAVLGGMVGLLLLAYGGLMFTGAVGLTGASERLRVDSCAMVWEGGKRATECYGQLLSPDGTLIDTRAAMQADARVGSTVAVRDLPVVGLETLGFRAVAGWATVTLLGLLLIDVGICAVPILRGPHTVAAARPRRTGRLARAVLAGTLVYGIAVLWSHMGP